MILFQCYPVIFTLVYKLSKPAVEDTAVHLGNNKWKEDVFIYWDLICTSFFKNKDKTNYRMGAEGLETQIHFKNSPKLDDHYYFKALSNKSQK